MKKIIKSFSIILVLTVLLSTVSIVSFAETPANCTTTGPISVSMQPRGNSEVVDNENGTYELRGKTSTGNYTVGDYGFYFVIDDRLPAYDANDANATRYVWVQAKYSPIKEYLDVKTGIYSGYRTYAAKLNSTNSWGNDTRKNDSGVANLRDDIEINAVIDLLDSTYTLYNADGTELKKCNTNESETAEWGGVPEIVFYMQNIFRDAEAAGYDGKTGKDSFPEGYTPFFNDEKMGTITSLTAKGYTAGEDSVDVISRDIKYSRINHMVEEFSAPEFANYSTIKNRDNTNGSATVEFTGVHTNGNLSNGGYTFAKFNSNYYAESNYVLYHTDVISTEESENSVYMVAGEMDSGSIVGSVPIGYIGDNSSKSLDILIDKVNNEYYVYFNGVLINKLPHNNRNGKTVNSVYLYVYNVIVDKDGTSGIAQGDIDAGGQSPHTLSFANSKYTYYIKGTAETLDSIKASLGSSEPKVNFASADYADGKYTFHIDVTSPAADSLSNGTLNDAKYTVYFAGYDAFDKLLFVENGYDQTAKEITKPEAAKLKAFIWGKDSLKPYINVINMSE